MIQLYESGTGTNEIAKRFNVHRSTVQQSLKKSSIKLRKRSPSHHYDVRFFSRYTPESCYWAGFIMADGCIRRTCLHIKLANKDRGHLRKFLDSIRADYQIRDHSNYCTIDVSGPWFLHDLKTKFGIVPRKTFITQYPDIPSRFDKHFIRGLLDGDGCITRTTCPSLNFAGTKKLLSTIAHKLRALGVHLKSGNEVPPFQRTNKNIGHIHYSGENAKLILRWIYQNSNNLLRLDRKHEKYQKLFG